MHYWSPKDREAFAEGMEGERRPDGGAYAIERPGSASAVVAGGRTGETRVLLLDPAPWPD